MGPVPEQPCNLVAAFTLLAALRRLGLARLVLCPGSRSTPLALAAAALEPRGLRLYTAIDERSAAFFALALGRAQGVPAAVVTTSGTAVANLLPAAVEADQGTVPLLLLTADRPARLKGCGANQTVNQEQFLRCCCRWFAEGPPQGLAVASSADLAAMAERAFAAATGQAAPSPPGPVQLNLSFEEPLHPGADQLRGLDGLWPPQPPAPPAPVPPAPVPPPPLPAGERAVLRPDEPGIVVAGPWRGLPSAWEAHLEAVRRWQRRTGWPVLADALSGLRGQPGLEVVSGYDLLLEAPAADLDPPQVLRLGPLPASRRLERWLERLDGPQVLVTEGEPRPLDPLRRVRHQWAAGMAAWVGECPGPMTGAPEVAPACREFAGRWRRAEGRLQRWLDGQLPVRRWSEPLLARLLARQLPPLLPVMLANSSPVRDWESFAPGVSPRPVHGFRGASGIDGTLSLACGLAEALGRAVLVSGDLALLHDGNGWLWSRQLRGRLTVVVIDNGGGGIFEQLPVRQLAPADLDFDRLFAMPQPVDVCALAAVHGIPARTVPDPAGLASALDWALGQPFALLRIPTDRQDDAVLRRRLRTMAQQAVSEP